MANETKRGDRSFIMKPLSWFWTIVFVLLTFVSPQTGIPQVTRLQETYKFIVMGDNRPDFPDAPPPWIFRRIIGEINSLHPDADFVVNTGDFIIGTDIRNKDEVRRQFNDFMKVIRKLTMRFYPVPGNHDAQYPDLYKDFLGKMYYSFDHKGSHFIIINSEESVITGTQWDWLRRDLQTAKGAEHIFVFIHRPINQLPIEIDESSVVTGHSED